jgi:hypothetical protein
LYNIALQHPYLKTEQHSPIFPPSQQQQQQQQQSHHVHHHPDEHSKHFETYYTELSSRDMSMTELEIQNNNAGFAWSQNVIKTFFSLSLADGGAKVSCRVCP